MRRRVEAAAARPSGRVRGMPERATLPQHETSTARRCLGGRDAEARCEAVPPPSRGSHVTLPPCGLDDVARDGEAEAGALSLGREERIEDARADGLGDAAAAVLHVDDDAHALGRDAHVDGSAAGIASRALRSRLSRACRSCASSKSAEAATGPRSSVDGAARQLDLRPREDDDLVDDRRARPRPPCAAAAGGRRAGTPRSGARGAAPRAGWPRAGSSPRRARAPRSARAPPRASRRSGPWPRAGCGSRASRARPSCRSPPGARSTARAFCARDRPETMLLEGRLELADLVVARARPRAR